MCRNVILQYSMKNFSKKTEYSEKNYCTLHRVVCKLQNVTVFLSLSGKSSGLI